MKTITQFFSPILLFSLFCAPVLTYAMEQNNNNNNNNAQQQQINIQSILKTPGMLAVDAVTDPVIELAKIKRALVSIIEQRNFPLLLATLCTKIADNSLTPERIKLLLANHPQYLSCIDFNQLAKTLNYRSLNELEPRDIIPVIKKDQFAQVFNCSNNAALESKMYEVASIVVNTLKKKKQETFVSVLKYEEFPHLLAVFLNTLADVKHLPEITKSLLACNSRYLPCIKFKEIAALLEKNSFDELQEDEVLATIDKQALAQFFNCSLQELRQKVDLPAIARTVIKLLQKEYDTVDPEDVVSAIDFGLNAASRTSFEVVLTYTFRMMKKVKQLPASTQNAVQNFDLIARTLGYLDTDKAQAVFTKITNREPVSVQELKDMLKPDVLALVTQRAWIDFDKLAELLHNLMSEGVLSSELLQEVFNAQNIQRDIVLAKLFGSFSQAPGHMAAIITKVLSNELDINKLEEALAKAIVHQRDLTHDDLQAVLKPEWRALAQENNLGTVIKDTQALVTIINTLLKAQAISQEQLHAAFDIPVIERLLDLQSGSIAHALNPDTSVQEDQKTLTLFKQLLASDKAKIALNMASGAALATSAALMYQAGCGNPESFCHGTAPTGFIAGALAGTLAVPALLWCKTALTKPAPVVNFAASFLVNKAKKLFIKPQVAPTRQEAQQLLPAPAQPVQAEHANTQITSALARTQQPEQSSHNFQIISQAQSTDNNNNNDDDEVEPEQSLRRRNVREQKRPTSAQTAHTPVTSTLDQPSTSARRPVAEQTVRSSEQESCWALIRKYYPKLVNSLTSYQRSILSSNVQEASQILSNAQTNPALLIKNSAFVHALDNKQLEILANLMGTQDVLMSLPDVSTSIKNTWRSHFSAHEGLLQLAAELEAAGTNDARYKLLKRPYILALSVYNPQLLVKETNFIASLNPELRNSITK